MASEVFNMREGVLRWVQASGTGNDPYTAWKTGTTPQSGTFAYVRSFDFTTGATLVTVKDRGSFRHHKKTMETDIVANMTVGWTGVFPNASAYNASVPMINLEHVSIAAGSSAYTQFNGVATDSLSFTEGEEENTMAFTFRALGVTTGVSGYLG